MDAYAEAYNEFRKTLLMFLFNSSSDESPVSKQWSLDNREHLGNVVFSTLRKATGMWYALNCIHQYESNLKSHLIHFFPRVICESEFSAQVGSKRAHVRCR